MPATKVSLWDAPKSCHDIMQWKVRDDPWKVLVVCVFCNQTRRFTAEPIMWKFFERWPSAESAAQADVEEVREMVKGLGFGKRRAQTLVKMSAGYLRDDWDDPSELYGVGKYASDAWHIFCVGDWKSTQPKDHALVHYHTWLWENLGREDRECSLRHLTRSCGITVGQKA